MSRNFMSPQDGSFLYADGTRRDLAVISDEDDEFVWAESPRLLEIWTRILRMAGTGPGGKRKLRSAYLSLAPPDDQKKNGLFGTSKAEDKMKAALVDKPGLYISDEAAPRGPKGWSAYTVRFVPREDPQFIIIDRRLVEAMEKADTHEKIIRLQYLVFATLLHELAHFFWGHFWGTRNEDGTERTSGESTRYFDWVGGDIPGESGFLFESRYFGGIVQAGKLWRNTRFDIPLEDPASIVCVVLHVGPRGSNEKYYQPLDELKVRLEGATDAKLLNRPTLRLQRTESGKWMSAYFKNIILAVPSEGPDVTLKEVEEARKRFRAAHEGEWSLWRVIGGNPYQPIDYTVEFGSCHDVV